MSSLVKQYKGSFDGGWRECFGSVFKNRRIVGRKMYEVCPGILDV